LHPTSAGAAFERREYLQTFLVRGQQRYQDGLNLRAIEAIDFIVGEVC
jgi:hypothetical protein